MSAARKWGGAGGGGEENKILRLNVFENAQCHGGVLKSVEQHGLMGQSKFSFSFHGEKPHAQLFD